jgi:hypothetical protein
MSMRAGWLNVLLTGPSRDLFVFIEKGPVRMWTIQGIR